MPLDIFPRRGRLFWSAAVALAVLIMVGLLEMPTQNNFFPPKPECINPPHATEVAEETKPPPIPDEKYDASLYTKGTPSKSLFDNLREDTKYLTGFSAVGWTNDVMSTVNMIYLATLTDRVAIVPHFFPSQHLKTQQTVPFGDVFDIPRLSKAINHPVIEWRDVKGDYSSRELLGCWSTWMTSGDGKPRGTPMYDKMGLDIAWTAAPNSTDFGDSSHTKLWSLGELSFPNGRQTALDESLRTHPASSERYTVPDDRFMCFDFLYYVCVAEPWEWDFDYNPFWRFVGRHLRFNQTIVDLSKKYLTETFGLQQGEAIPYFIAVHIRRGDFIHNMCDGGIGEGCARPLSAWHADVQRVQRELLQRKGIDAKRVVLTSDESDPAWWAEAHGFGWSRLPHDTMGTTEKLGEWYEVFVDVCVGSMAVGFVGTKGSTFSRLSQKRVEEWNDGVAILMPMRSQ